jgi:putative PIN family toxin of toxin-antitoxin system
MKVVIDTNVLVSAILRDRNPEAVILWVLSQDEWEWLVSPEIMQEYLQILRRPKFAFSSDLLSKWDTLLERDTTSVSVDDQVEFPRDQKDAKFLACALSNNADYLITGDSDFSEAQKLLNTTILSVSLFKRLVTGET